MEYDFQGQSILQGEIRDFPNTTLAQYFSNGLTNGTIQRNHLALIDSEKEHTFHQLDDISTKLRNAILESVQNLENRNPDGDPVIGVCIQPSDRLITILFGILKAGAAYVPFDITFPEERILKIVKDCRPLLVICDGKSNVLGKFESAKSYTKVISTDELYRIISPFKIYSFPAIPSRIDPNAPEATAIVLYTSGSSGEPKGVRLSHKVVMNRLSWQWEKFPFISTEKCVFKTALTFVDSVAEIFAPLLKGYQLVVFDKLITSQPSLFLEKLHSYAVTRVVVVPSLLKAILQTLSVTGNDEGQKLLASVRLWVCSGESLSYDLLSGFFSKFPENFTLCNFYGSTEVMADVTFVSYSSEKDVELKCCERRVPIGIPVQNTLIYILNKKLQLVGEGQLGSIYIAGSNLATGYVGIPNSDKFLNNEFSTDHPKLYQTGDFGRIVQLDDGTRNLMFEGRIDSQIKVRGQRVDLSEIEAVISEFDIVSKLKVLCYHPSQEDQTIVAYVVPKSQLNAEETVKHELQNHLREHERPVIRILKEIPLLVNGKTDRQRLLKMYEAELQKREEFDEWFTLGISTELLPTAKTLLKILSEITGTSIQLIAENIDDSFFNIGGNSLNTVVVIVKLRENGYYISIPEFTSSLTIRDILENISVVEEERVAEEQNENFMVSLLADEDKDEVVNIISYSFSKKGDLEAYVNASYGEYKELIQSMWSDIVEKRFSFIVRRSSTGQAVAVSLSFDAYDEPNIDINSKGIKYVMDFLEYFESQQRRGLAKGKGKLFHSFMMGTREDIDDSERVLLIELMEEQNILIAKQHQFDGIFTTNTNPLTMQIGRDLQGYEILCEYQVNQYVADDGVKPFCLAPDSFKIICCWKELLH